MQLYYAPRVPFKRMKSISSRNKEYRATLIIVPMLICFYKHLLQIHKAYQFCTLVIEFLSFTCRFLILNICNQIPIYPRRKLFMYISNQIPIYIQRTLSLYIGNQISIYPRRTLLDLVIKCLSSTCRMSCYLIYAHNRLIKEADLK